MSAFLVQIPTAGLVDMWLGLYCSILLADVRIINVLHYTVKHYLRKHVCALVQKARVVSRSPSAVTLEFDSISSQQCGNCDHGYYD